MPAAERCEVVVVGDGIVGLCCAVALERRGMRPVLVGRRREGLASTAAAGLLAPTIETSNAPALPFSLAARDRYPSFLSTLAGETGVQVPLALDGIVRVPEDDEQAEALGTSVARSTRWLDAAEIRQLEPALEAPRGAILYETDGMVDNVRLMEALDRRVALGAIRRIHDDVVRVDFPEDADAVVVLRDAPSLHTPLVVLATGAWTSQLGALPTFLPITPLRGQMLALQGAVLRRPTYLGHQYLVPRAASAGGITIAGSTSELVGFSPGTTAEALARLESVARRLTPRVPVVALRAWSGLRPMTPDGLPIIGLDERRRSLILAVGHSRNGILMAPLTGDVVARLATGEDAGVDLRPLSPRRFQSDSRTE